MCDKAVDDCLAPLKFVLDWFLTSKMITILFAALYVDENILQFNEDSNNVVFICNELDILNVNLDSINLNNTNYDEDDSDTIIFVRIQVGILNLKNIKHIKKN